MEQTASFSRAHTSGAGIEFTVAVVHGEDAGGSGEAYREVHSRALVSRLKPVGEPQAFLAPPRLLALAEARGFAILVARDGEYS